MSSNELYAKKCCGRNQTYKESEQNSRIVASCNTAVLGTKFRKLDKGKPKVC